MSSNFETQIDTIVVNTKARLLAVTRQSISDMIEDVQTPVVKGGKMRVDTGFLRSSGVAALNAPPSGPTKGEKDQTYVYSGDPIEVTLGQMEIGDTFYFGWTARYAKFREFYDGFLESGLQKWQSHVDNSINKLKGR